MIVVGSAVEVVIILESRAMKMTIRPVMRTGKKTILVDKAS